MTRLLTVLACAVLLMVAMAWFKEPLYSAVRWIDMLAPKPGLSGLALLALSPLAFLLLASIARWIVTGFRPDDTLTR